MLNQAEFQTYMENSLYLPLCPNAKSQHNQNSIMTMRLPMSAQLTSMETRIDMDYSSHGDASVQEEIEDVFDEEDDD